MCGDNQFKSDRIYVESILTINVLYAIMSVYYVLILEAITPIFTTEKPKEAICIDNIFIIDKDHDYITDKKMHRGKFDFDNQLNTEYASDNKNK